MEIALIGNPNCGKTTLFNLLTGARQRVGNRMGVTTEKKEGKYTKDNTLKIVDLPGLYTITTLSKDEQAVSDYITKTPPDVIINILDGTNLERNLYLTSELLDLRIPIVLAVNMADDLEKNGIILNAEALSNSLGVQVVKISAKKNINIDELVSLCKTKLTIPKPLDFYNESGEDDVSKRYSLISKIVKDCVSVKRTNAQNLTEKLDAVLTHKFWGIPILILVILLTYYLSFSIGGLFSGYVSRFFTNLSKNTGVSLSKINSPQWLIGLVCAIINGVGGVMEFLPQILVLFLLLALLEESGYTSRVAFNLDKIFRFFGINGKTIIPLILACGCTVSGLMATRTIENEEDRKRAVMLVPFMPCGAKLAVFGWFSYAFFGSSPIVATSLFFLSIISVCLFGKLLKLKNKEKTDSAFILEMPTYRMPSPKSVFFVLWEKTKEFCVKAGTVMFAVSVLLWLSTNFGFYGYTDGNSEGSFLYYIGNALKFIFIPLGFGNWQSSVAVLSGSLAKEAVIETLSVLCSDVDFLFYNNFSVYAFLAFVLLSPPCIASIMQAKRELNDRKSLAFMLIFQTLSAYIVALVINLIGFAFSFIPHLIFIFITAIIILITAVCLKRIISVKTCAVKNGRCYKCRKR